AGTLDERRRAARPNHPCLSGLVWGALQRRRHDGRSPPFPVDRSRARQTEHFAGDKLKRVI
ncbi:MAG TPA: hypothetical protein VEF36_09345, partial [Roseiarcus sp.]|nr:hypothetical protein [Roseiarcus sp.]